MKPCVFLKIVTIFAAGNSLKRKLDMKKVIVSAMMIMAFLCSTTTVNAQSDNKPKAKKECCDKKAEKKDCCKKEAEKACCGADCKKCTECKANCSETNCKDCKHKGQCKKNCKK